LNDNLRLFEEQQHRQVNYSFGLTGTRTEALTLRALTRASDTEDYISPIIEEQVDITETMHPAITNKPGILETIDASNYLVFQDVNKKEVS
jgi:hypothetical protein